MDLWNHGNTFVKKIVGNVLLEIELIDLNHSSYLATIIIWNS